jgi:hypothetical protein
MRKIIQIAVFFSLIFCATNQSFGQQIASVDPDIVIKEPLYTKYKKEVISFDKKDFDTLFFEFFQKQSDSKITLTKEEYYTYTIKIAIYSVKLGLLYKDQKEESDKAKQEWFNKSYAEYLKSKP